MVLIQANNIGFWYNINEWIIRQLDLKIFKAEILGFLGASGVGKTTLIKMLAGLLSPKEGSLTVIEGVRSVIMFQDSFCLPWYTAVKNVMIAAKVSLDEAQKLLKKMGLETYANHYPAQLSGGMKTRLAASMAIASKADILMFDEPFSGLDELNKTNLDNFMGLLKSDGKTVIIITHDVFHAAKISDRLLILGKKRNYNIIDGLKDKLNSSELYSKIFELSNS